MKKKSVTKKIVISILLVLVLFIGSIGVQFAINFSIKPIPTGAVAGDTTNYNTGGLDQLLYKYDLAKKDPASVDSQIFDTAYVSKELEGTINHINARFDCADFNAVTLIRFYLENEEILSDVNKNEIKKCLLGFKYWMDQGGEDSMCFWSENHQILFAVTEFLVAQTFPNEKFFDGDSSENHLKNSSNRIESWCKQRFEFGFNEYYSNNYYPEDIAPISCFLQFADDDVPYIAELKNKMTMILDLIWFDIASQSYKYQEGGRTFYAFMSASGRMYFDNKSSDDTGNRLRVFTDFVLQNETATVEIVKDDATTLVKECDISTNKFFNSFKHAVENGNYVLPNVIKEIFDDNSKEQIVKSSSGVNVEELKQFGLLGQSDAQIMMQFGMEAFSNSDVVDNTIKYLSKNKMFSNEFLNDFKLVNLYPFTLTNTLKSVSALLKPCYDGVAIERGNVYTYQTESFSMSTSQAHQAGGFGDQQQISLATLAKDLSIYTMSPMRNSSREGYWVGQGRMPYSCQDKNVNLSIYKVPTVAGFLEPHVVPFVHTYFPVGLFDEVDETHMNDGYIFGKKGDAYIGIISSETLHFKEFNENDFSKIKGNVQKLLNSVSDKRYDLISEGDLEQFYVTELSSASVESFDEFKNRLLENEFEFSSENMSMKYHSGQTLYESKFDKHFKVNGNLIDTNYKRFDSPYSVTERNAQQIVISFNKKELILNYAKNIRTVSEK